MSGFQRIKEVVIGLLSLAFAAVMMAFPETGCSVIMLVICATLIFGGLGKIVYYFAMARHMVGGKTALYAGTLLFDLGMLAGSLATAPQNFLVLALLGGHLFTGAVGVAQAITERNMESPVWKWTLAQGLANIIIAMMCIAFRKSPTTMVYLYCAGMIYSACVRIAKAFRRTAIVYIP